MAKTPVAWKVTIWYPNLMGEPGKRRGCSERQSAWGWQTTGQTRPPEDIFHNLQFFKIDEFVATFKYSSSSPPSSWMIRQVISSALQKTLLVASYVFVQFTHWATAPMAKWSAQLQSCSPTWVTIRSTFQSEGEFSNLSSCDDDLLLQLCDALHVLHVAKILQTSLDIKNCSLKFQWHCNLMTLLEDLEDVRGNGRGYHSPQRLHTTVTWLQFQSTYPETAMLLKIFTSAPGKSVKQLGMSSPFLLKASTIAE